MTCGEARRRLLEAEPRELEESSGDALGEHLVTCAACAASVAEILAFQDDLDDVLGRVPPIDVAELVRLARTPDGGGHEGRRRAGWRERETWVSLAAAAAIAALMLWPRPPRPLPGDPWSAPRVDPPTVEAPTDRDVAVLPTSNPDITVIWLF